MSLHIDVKLTNIGDRLLVTNFRCSRTNFVPDQDLNFVTNIQKYFPTLKDSANRRTLVFAAFGGSKFGNLASTEWVLQNKKKIENRLVAYINLDEIITSVETNQLESGKFL